MKHDIEKNRFEEGRDILYRTLLGPGDGKPYPWFEIGNSRYDYEVTWTQDMIEDGDELDDTLYPKITFSSRSGPKLDISAATHELGHMMIASPEQFGQEAWGLKNPKVFMSGIMIDEMPSPNHTQIKMEAKAWAWQYLIECTAGLRRFGIPDKDGNIIPHHSESRFLNDGNMLSEDEAIQVSEKYIRMELKKIIQKYPDWKKHITDTMKNIGNLLKEEEKHCLTADESTVFKKIEENIVNEDEYSKDSIVVYELQKGWYQVCAEMHQRDTIDENFSCREIKELCLTRNKNKAMRFYGIACNINKPEDQNDMTPKM